MDEPRTDAVLRSDELVALIEAKLQKPGLSPLVFFRLKETRERLLEAEARKSEIRVNLGGRPELLSEVWRILGAPRRPRL